MRLNKDEIFIKPYDLRRKYSEFYSELYNILSKHSDNPQKHPNEFLLPQDTLKFDTGLSVTDIQKIASQQGYDYSIEEITLLLYNLLVKEQKVVRKDYWDKEPIYELIDTYLWKSRLQRNYHDLRDNAPNKVKVIAFMSDTHIGLDGIYNPKLINNFYDYIIGQGATRCFHLGDLFEGLRKLPKQEIESEFYRQIDLFLKDYPRPTLEELITYLAGGNHDESMGLFMGNCPLDYIDPILDSNGRVDTMAEYVKEDYNHLRYITALNPSIMNIPQSRGGISGWSTTANGRNFHFDHRLFLSYMQPDCRISNVKDIQDKMKFKDYHYDVLVSGHLHKGIIFSTTNEINDTDKLYLGVPSTSNINLNGVVGYLVYLDEAGENLEISILGSDESDNIIELERIPWSFTEKNKQYCKQF